MYLKTILVLLDSLILPRNCQTRRPIKQHTAARNAGGSLLHRTTLSPTLLVREILALSGTTKGKVVTHTTRSKIALLCMLSLSSGWLRVSHSHKFTPCSIVSILIGIDVVHSILLSVYSLSAFARDEAVEDGALEGKLSCIHCGARLGYFNWSGIQCNCGSWITPAFQISKSKVDISTI